MDDFILKNIWYYAALSTDIKVETVKRLIIANHPIALYRTKTGELQAVRDICPHRAAPFSAGKVEGEEIECPYHGWRFGKDGHCSSIPALTETSPIECYKFRVKKYLVQERNGIIWIFLSEDKWGDENIPSLDIPPLPNHLTKPQLIEEITMDCTVNDAIIGLMDPAHGPFVHQSWFWRTKKSIHAKKKDFAPSDYGFKMVRHQPSKNAGAYKILGGEKTTEITFRLPGIRIEHICVGKYDIIGLTCVTPQENNKTCITQIFYWNIPVLSLLKPFARPLIKRFLKQDGDMMALQTANLPYNPVMTLIDDADTQAKWYYKLCREWIASQNENRIFENPVTAKTLEWKS